MKPHVNIGVIGHNPRSLLVTASLLGALSPMGQGMLKEERPDLFTSKFPDPKRKRDHERVAAAEAKRQRKKALRSAMSAGGGK